MRLEYHPSTAADLTRAIDLYNGQRPGLGAECRAEVYEAIDRIRESPTRYPIVEAGVRRCLVRRFPFSILYRVIGNDVVRILVIRHHRQRSGLGQARR